MKHIALVFFLASCSAHAMQSHSAFFEISGRTSPFRVTKNEKGIRCGCLDTDHTAFLTVPAPVTEPEPALAAKVLSRAALRASMDDTMYEETRSYDMKSDLRRVRSLTALVALLFTQCTPE